MDLSLRRSSAPTSLQKWYIDVLLDDGAVLLVYLVRVRVFGVLLARVTAQLFESNGRVISGSAVARRVRGAGDRLRFGPASIDGERLVFETRGLSGALSYRPRCVPLSLKSPFVEVGGRVLTWDVEVPDADVTGELVWPGGSASVHGRGYRDRVFFDLPVWRFPIHELHWGRAVAGPHTATWVRASTDGGVVEAAALDEERFRQPGAGAPPPGVLLDEGRALLDEDVMELEGLALGPLQRPLRWLSGDPHQKKTACPATIHGEPGRAVHEVVRWRGGA